MSNVETARKPDGTTLLMRVTGSHNAGPIRRPISYPCRIVWFPQTPGAGSAGVHKPSLRQTRAPAGMMAPHDYLGDLQHRIRSSGPPLPVFCDNEGSNFPRALFGSSRRAPGHFPRTLFPTYGRSRPPQWTPVNPAANGQPAPCFTWRTVPERGKSCTVPGSGCRRRAETGRPAFPTDF